MHVSLSLCSPVKDRKKDVYDRNTPVCSCYHGEGNQAKRKKKSPAFCFALLPMEDDEAVMLRHIKCLSREKTRAFFFNGRTGSNEG